MPNVGYATLQIIPSVRGIAEDIRRQLAPAAAEGERAGRETGGGFGEAFRNGLAAVGLVALASTLAEGISAAFTDAIDQSGVPGRLKAQLGTTGPIAKQYGDLAGKLYAGGITDSVETAAEDVRAVAGAGLLPPGATQAQIKTLTTQFADFTGTFEQDSGLTSQAVSAMIRNGLAKDGTAALDLLTVGFQKLGPRADDLVETMQEYPVQLRKLGLSGQQSLGLFSQGLKGGARDTDIVADALKEFSIRSIDMSQSSQDAYKGLGLSAKGMSKQIAKGGTEATKGLQTVLDKLRGIKDPVKQSQLAVGLFGTQAEDLGRALFSLDPSTAVKAVGDVGGAANQMGTDLRDNAGARLTQFTRGVQQGLVTVLGGQVLPRVLAVGEAVNTRFGPPLSRVAALLSTKVGPGMDAVAHFLTDDLVPGLRSAAGWVDRNSRSLEIAAAIVTAVLLPVFITLGVGYATAGAAAVVSGAQQIGMWLATSAGAVGSAAAQLIASYRTVGGWLLMASTAVVSGARVVAGWILTGLAAASGAIASGIAVAGVVAGWILMGLQSLLQAARMAAAWLIAMGPLGWVIAAVLAITALVIANWSTISRWTSQIWGAVSRWVMNAISTVVGFARAHWPLLLGILTGPIGLAVYAIIHYWGQISGAFTGAYRAVVGTGRSLVVWVGGLPGRIAGQLASLGGRLYGTATSAFERLRAGAAEKTTAVLTAVKELPGQVVAALGDLSRLLYDSGQKLIGGFLDGIASMAGKAAGAAKNVLGKVKGFFPHSPAKEGPFSGRGYTLYSGRALIQGLADGITSRTPVAVTAMRGTAAATANAFAADMGIHSPSKRMAELGRWAGLGLVQGLTGTGAQVSAAAKKVADLVKKAFLSSAVAQIAADRQALARLGDSKADRIRAAALRRDIASQQRIAHAGAGLARIIAKDTDRLAVLAKHRDAVAGRLKAAQEKLTALRTSWADLRDQVAGGIVSAASLTRDLPEGTAVTAASILARLTTDVKSAQLFTAQLASLRKKGLRADLVNQIGQAGVEGGGATAAALAAATPAQIRAINQQQAALAKAAGKAGAVAADAMYASGIRAAQGLVDGLKAQEKAIEAQMLRIARSMQAAIRRELDMHSPSRVMHRLGRLTGLGLIGGLDGQRGAVDAAMRRLVAVPAVPGIGAPAGAGQAGRASQGRPIEINLYGAHQSFAEQRADLVRHMALVQ